MTAYEMRISDWSSDVCSSDLHPQVAAMGMRVEVDDPDRGPVVMPGVPINLTATPGAVRGPAPALGEHSGKVAPWPAQPRPAADARPLVRSGPRSEERPVGKECVRTGRSRGGPEH